MSEFRLSFPARFLAGKSRLSADDVQTLRRVSFPEGIRASEDAAQLLAIHHSFSEKCDEWDAFFIEALTDFIVHHTYPQGSLDDINVAWLIQVLSTDGIIRSSTEFEVLMHVIDVSAHIPPALSGLALDQLSHALGGGACAYREARSIDARGVTGHDIAFIRHVLRTSGMILSPIEIEALDRIEQASAARDNHPGWAELRNTAKLRQGESERHGRWLRVPDEMFVDVGTAA